MLVKFSRTESLATAVEKTFDGKHGCNLCQLVEQGKKAEQKQNAQTSVVKIDFFLVQTVEFFVSPAHFEPIGFAAPAFFAICHSPLSPPPKTA